MPKLLDICEDSARDVAQAYAGAVLKDTKTGIHMLVEDVDGNDESVTLFYRDSKKVAQKDRFNFEYLNEHIKAVYVEDGYINLNGYCLYLERTYDRKYKKCTTLNNTSVEALGAAYIRYHKTKVKRELDAYTVLKALQHRYYTFREALAKAESMFSVAMSPQLALVKQPVSEGPEPLHVVYNTVYVGEVNPTNGIINFDNQEIHSLVIEQLREVGYEAA